MVQNSTTKTNAVKRGWDPFLTGELGTMTDAKDLITAVLAVLVFLGSLLRFFNERSRAYALATESFALAKCLGEAPAEEDEDPRNAETAYELQQVLLRRGIYAAKEYASLTIPRRSWTDAVIVALLIAASGSAVWFLPVPPEWQISKIGVFIGVVLVWIYVCVGMANAKLRQDQNVKELAGKLILAQTR